MSDVPTDEDREAILARRKRWVAMAIAGVATSAMAQACACLAPTYDAGTVAADAGRPDDGGAPDGR